jgi:CRP-like cAMP-binding protein
MRLTTPTPTPNRRSDSMSRPTPEMLRSLELFHRLPDAELEQLGCIFEKVAAPPGTRLETQDVPVRHWSLLVHGHAVVERDATPIGLVGPGDSWCEHSILNDLRSSIGVVALSPVTMLRANRDQFFALPEDHPVLAGRLVARSAGAPDRLALPVWNALVHMTQRSTA